MHQRLPSKVNDACRVPTLALTVTDKVVPLDVGTLGVQDTVVLEVHDEVVQASTMIVAVGVNDDSPKFRPKTANSALPPPTEFAGERPYNTGAVQTPKKPNQPILQAQS